MNTTHTLRRLITRKKHAVVLFLLATVASVLGGACTSGLIALVHGTIRTAAAADAWTMTQFFGLLAGHTVFGILAAYASARLSYGVILELRMELSERILAASLKDIEDVGLSHLRTVLAEVSEVVSNAIEDLPKLLTRFALVVGLFAYLAWLSPLLFSVLLSFLVLGTVAYVVPTRLYRRYQERIWDARHVHFGYLHALVDGIKELLQSRARKNALLDQFLRPSGDRFIQVKVRSVLLDSGLERWGEVYAMLGLAFILFVLPEWGWTTYQEVGSFLFILLFALAPLTTLIGFYFRMQDVRAALLQVETVGVRLDALADGRVSPDGAGSRTFADLAGQPLSLEFRGISYTYHHVERSEEFTLGPLSFNVGTPEILFVTGGNGSGKSTLAKLICGLYAPESGSITLNGTAISDANREAYRQLFSVIFVDFYLFEVLLGLDRADLDRTGEGYLEKVRLSRKVSVRNGAFTTTRLSHGQRKRLALVQAWLEDRDIYVFDEWAGDQDATFKAVFYNELIPELKRQGKIVIVISHDDTYFHVADQVIRLVDGQRVDRVPG